MRAAAAIALLAFIAFPAFGQEATATVMVGGIDIKVGPLGDSPGHVAWKVLASRENVDSAAALRKKATETLERDGKLLYTYQRVEVEGMMVAGDTSETDPGMIDKQVKLSYANDVPGESWTEKIKRKLIFFRDLEDAFSDTEGKPSTRATNAISQLKGAKINELFAHSWGTEAVYLGLLNGTILPPKKLVLVGVPEDSEAKWRVLAEFTGIEVHVIGFHSDKVKTAGSLALKFRSGLPKDTVGQENLWRRKCAEKNRSCADPAKFVPTKFNYDIHARPPDSPKDEFFRLHLSKMDHDKSLYYRYLFNRKLFNKTIDQLAAPQLKLIEMEENRILAEADQTARRLIAEAKVKIERAKRIHDAELLSTLLEIAARSCSNPGSVGQVELNNIPQPLTWDFGLVLPEQITDNCVLAHFHAMANRLKDRKRLWAGDLGSRPKQVVSPVATVPSQGPADISPAIPFAAMLPGVRNLAANACHSPGSASMRGLIPSLRIFFSPDDEDAVNGLLAGMGDCERALFKRLVSLIRSGQGGAIDDEWIRKFVESTRPVTTPGSGGTGRKPPRDDGDGGGGEKPGCFVDKNGIRGCPP